jgi:hypothetical protein
LSDDGERKRRRLASESQAPGLAQSVCEGLVDEVRIVDGALLLTADPAWAWAINIVLVTKGVMVSELRRAGDLRTD